jgi:hypothetical protein
LPVSLPEDVRTGTTMRACRQVSAIQDSGARSHEGQAQRQVAARRPAIVQVSPPPGSPVGSDRLTAAAAVPTSNLSSAGG